MSDASSGTPAGNTPPPGSPPPIAAPHHPPFPVIRLLYAFGYGLIAWFVMHIIFALAVVQFVMLAISGRVNDEVKSFSLTLLQYEWELLAFVTFVRDEQPFPVGPFPKHA
jgi:Domain of unknown function (DUF4389)